jgi:hypothetical protein
MRPHDQSTLVFPGITAPRIVKRTPLFRDSTNVLCEIPHIKLSEPWKCEPISEFKHYRVIWVLIRLIR